jgi:ATP/ADP translocase
MNRLADWLDIRPDEVRKVVLSFFGAFLVISFLILGRSLREALYLTTFPVETLPYITAAVALLSVPTVAAFARLISRRSPQTVLKGVMVVLAIGIGVAGWATTRSPAAVVLFYLLVALGALLLTSGFWLVTAELFPVRGAKRLFGLIGAGGTLGAMVTGNTLAVVAGNVGLSTLVPGLIVILGLFFLVEMALPRLPGTAAPSGKDRTGGQASVWRGLGDATRSRHLRTIALIVFVATVASTLIDYQFKELAQANFAASTDPGVSLAGFFGAFYGWTGGVSLLVQVLLAGRLLASAGLGITLAILPLTLLLGSAGLLLIPSLVLATLVRGADNSLRKSLHRAALEVLWVPIPDDIRRKTKTFIDSVVDAVGEGTGAAIVLLWVTIPGFPSRYLSIFVALLAVYFLYLSRRMGTTYVETVTDQLHAGRAEAGGEGDQRDLLSVSFTHIDIRPLLEESGVATATTEISAVAARATAAIEQARAGAEGSGAGDDAHASESGAVAATPRDVLVLLGSSRSSQVLEALTQTDTWDATHVPALTRLLARDAFYEQAVAILRGIEREALPHLTATIRDDATDFVIRRRIPRVLARYRSAAADDALLDVITAPRFEVRYRATIGLVRRRRAASELSARDWREMVWEAVRSELGKERPVWELQRLLDESDPPDDELVVERVGVRGELSLEHTFRLLSLVLEPEAVRSAFHGLTQGNERLNSLALEYLEHALPEDVRKKLWPVIGDLSEYQRARTARPLSEVVSDLVKTDATLFASETERGALRKLLDEGGGPPEQPEP